MSKNRRSKFKITFIETGAYHYVYTMLDLAKCIGVGYTKLYKLMNEETFIYNGYSVTVIERVRKTPSSHSSISGWVSAVKTDNLQESNTELRAEKALLANENLIAEKAELRADKELLMLELSETTAELNALKKNKLISFFVKRIIGKLK